MLNTLEDFSFKGYIKSGEPKIVSDLKNGTVKMSGCFYTGGHPAMEEMLLLSWCS